MQPLGSQRIRQNLVTEQQQRLFTWRVILCYRENSGRISKCLLFPTLCQTYVIILPDIHHENLLVFLKVKFTKVEVRGAKNVPRRFSALCWTILSFQQLIQIAIIIFHQFMTPATSAPGMYTLAFLL